MWSFLESARDRLKNFLAEIEHLEQSEFPYKHSKAALSLLRAQFQNKLSILESFDSSSDIDTVKQTCSISLNDLFTYLPLLGFILRSTNVRNAFEVFGPFLNLVRAVLDGSGPATAKTSLVLSSEWDYSPLAFDQIPNLPGFVFIGLPACESSNPLLLPLAGHELGHAVWAKNALETHFKPAISQAVISTIQSEWTHFRQVFALGAQTKKSDLTSDLFLIQTWEPIVSWATCQAEESFCDFVGLRLFGESYLYAFAYLLSPTPAGQRSTEYPRMSKRVENIVKAAQMYVITCPADYTITFDDELPPSFSQGNSFRLSVSEKVLDTVIGSVIRKADEILQQVGAPIPSDAEAKRIYERFRLVVPAEACKSMSDILNAGWRAARDPKLWIGNDQVYKKRTAVIKELTLKTIEVFEIESIPP